MTEFEYDLEVKFDHGSSQTLLSQWFYFKISNTKRGQPYRFNLINMIKPDSLYNHGMKPLMYSKKESETKFVGWHRVGTEIKYYPTKRRIG